MVSLYKLLVMVMVACVFFPAAAQTNPAKGLIQQGVELYKQGNYAEAIARYNEALQTDPQNAYGNYQMALSLYASKKLNEAISYLETAAKGSNPSVSVPAYCLLATIDDEGNQSQKAIDTYNTAIKINPDYPQIYYNLGLVYSRARRYAEADTAAIEAIKHNPKNAGNQRLYALVTFHQNKRVNALMGFCSFLMLEPTGPRAAEAFGNIQHIMQGGVLKDGDARTGAAAQSVDKETTNGNAIITSAAQTGQAKKLTGLPLLEYELNTIFILTGQSAERKASPTFVDRYYAAYFYQLAQSGYMPALIHTIATSVNPGECANWAKLNTQQIRGLAEWMEKTEHSF